MEDSYKHSTWKEPKTLAELAAEAAQANDLQGLECPTCACKHWKIVRTVRMPGYIKRERRCRHCGHPMTTIEKPD